jgi:hypothetical protein
VLAESGNSSEALEELGAAVVSAEQTDGGERLDEVMDDFHDLVTVIGDDGTPVGDEMQPGPVAPPVLVPYVAWDPRPIPELTALEPSDVAVLLAEVVDVEGPVLAERAYQLLRNASRAGRLGNQIRHALDRGVNSALRRGLISASPWEEDSLRRVLDRPDPQPTEARQLGDRDVKQVPVAEIGALVEALQAADPDLDGERLKRATLDAYGLIRLTPNVDAFLTQSIRKAERRNVRRSVDEVAARAAECGVGDEFAAWVALITELGWEVRAWPGSVTATPLGRSSPTFVHLAPRPGGLLKVKVDFDGLGSVPEIDRSAFLAADADWAVLDAAGSALLRGRVASAVRQS